MTWSRLTLRSKLNIFVCINAFIGLLLVASGFSYIFINNQFQEKENQALHIAEMVAQTPDIIRAFHSPHPSREIEPFAERIRTELGAEFVVVANMNLVRYSHPNAKLIGIKMDESDNDDQLVLHGHPSISKAIGTLGLSVRGKYPIISNGHQIGLVSVGFLVQDIWKQIALSLFQVIGISVGGLILSILGAHLMSGHVKRQIFGMEPAEIAYLVQEQSAILQSIREGIIAVDSAGRVTACNEEASRILGVPQSVVGKKLQDVLNHQRIRDVISNGPNYVDQPMVIGNTLIVANRVPVQLNHEDIGSVMTFRDKIQLDQMERRLQDIEHYTDDLRSQRHEFMNRLHTISGLIYLKEYDVVCELIDQINSEQHQLLSFFSGKIRDPAVLGLIVGKMHRTRELGIQLEVDVASTTPERCHCREIVVTVLGNAIDNAMEAIQGQNTNNAKTMTVSIHEDAESMTVSVRDSGPGVDPMLGERIFEDGVSSKGFGRGLGLSICAQMVAGVEGSLTIRSSSLGSLLQMVLPKGGE